MPLPLASYISIIVALIALVGVIVTIIIQTLNFGRQLKSAHALKVAEMRQQWINNLRDAMAKFQSYGIAPELDHVLEREFYESGTKVELFMNPDDENFEELQTCMYRFLTAKDIDEKYSANAPYVSICQKILKRKWETLKKDLKIIKRKN